MPWFSTRARRECSRTWIAFRIRPDAISARHVERRYFCCVFTVMSCSDHLGRTKRRAALLFVLIVVAGGLVHVATAWAAPTDDVTLRIERFYDNACRCYKLRF